MSAHDMEQALHQLGGGTSENRAPGLLGFLRSPEGALGLFAAVLAG